MNVPQTFRGRPVRHVFTALVERSAFCANVRIPLVITRDVTATEARQLAAEQAARFFGAQFKGFA